jgi:hypothetical protein
MEKTVTIKISSTIKDEVYLAEMFKRDGSGATIYQKIMDAQIKSGYAKIEATIEEAKELYQEADYWSDSFDQYMMSRGQWMAWRALKKQLKEMA